MKWWYKNFRRTRVLLLIEHLQGWHYAYYKQPETLPVCAMCDTLEEAIQEANKESSESFDKMIILPLEKRFRWRQEVLPILSETDIQNLVYWESEDWFGVPSECVCYDTIGGDADKQYLLLLMFNKQDLQIENIINHYRTQVTVMSNRAVLGDALSSPHGVILFLEEENAVLYRNRLPVKTYAWESIERDDIIDQIYTDVDEIAKYYGITIDEWHVVTDIDEEKERWETHEMVKPWFVDDVLEETHQRWNWPWQVMFYPAILAATSRLLAFHFDIDKRVQLDMVMDVSSKWRKIIMMIVGCLLGYSLIGGVYHYNAYQQVRKEYLAHETKRRQLTELQNRNQHIAERISFLLEEQKRRTVWGKQLVLIADSLPSGMRLTSIRTEGDKISIEGIYTDVKRLNNWKRYLEKRLQMKINFKYGNSSTEAAYQKRFSLILEKEVDDDTNFK